MATATPLVPYISVENVIVGESDGKAVFRISLSDASANPVTVSYTTIDIAGGASAGLDYITKAEALTFAPGELVKTVEVSLIGDGAGEFAESFRLQLSAPVNALIDPKNSGYATILDDDATTTRPVASVSGAVVYESTGVATFYISLDKPLAAGSLVVNYHTTDGSATAGVDYTAIANGSITFLPGELVKAISVPVVADTVPEPDKSFTLNISVDPTAATLANPLGSATAVIEDMGVIPSIDNPIVDESAGFARFTVTLGAPATTDQTYIFSTVAGDATSGVDYVGTTPITQLPSPPIPSTDPNTITIKAGQTQAIISIPLIDDTIPEGDESFSLLLVGLSGSFRGGISGTATIRANDLPGIIANDDAATTTQDQPVTFSLISNDANPNNDLLTVTSTSPAHGALVINPIGTVIYTPSANYVGADNFIYTIKDGQGRTSSAVVSITVTNGTPTATDDAATTPQNTAIIIPVLANDSDPNNDLNPLPTLATLPANGTAVVGSDGRVTYTPKQGFWGSDPFTYTIKDALGHTATGTVNVTVPNTGPGVPTAAGDTAATSQDVRVTIPVLANDTDPENDPLSITALGSPAHGTAVQSADGKQVVYTPTAGYFGTDNFTYTVSDGQGHSNVGLVQVTVADGTPTAVTDTVTTSQDQPITIPVLQNDTDPQGDPLRITAVGGNGTDPEHGTVTVSGTGDIIYKPQIGYVGPDRFSYTVSDSLNHIRVGLVSINVTNGTPVALTDTATTSGGRSVDVLVLANDSDPQSDSLSVTAVSAPSQGVASFDATGKVTYTPALNYAGTDSFTYTINDGQGHNATGTINITVADGKPVAVADSTSTSIGRSVDINVLANDTDPQGDDLTVASIASQPFFGKATLGNNGIITYKPTGNTTGTDSFTYTVRDPLGHTATGTVNVTITTGAPTAVPDFAITDQGVPVEINVLANDSDPEGNSLSVTAVTTPGHGTAAVGKSGTITYTPATGYSGYDYFYYTLSDSQGHTDITYVELTVNGINHKPTLQNPIPDQLGLQTLTFFRYTVPSNTFVDSDTGDRLSYKASKVDGSALPAWLMFDPASHDFLGTPASGDVGSFNVKVTATDQGGLSESDTFTITVAARTSIAAPVVTPTTPVQPTTPVAQATPVATNHAPTTADHAVNLAESGTYKFTAGDFPFTDQDSGDSLQSVKIGSLPTDGTLKLAGQSVGLGQTIARSDIDAGKLTFEASTKSKDLAPDFSFQVGDGQTLSTNQGTFTLNLTPNGSARTGSDQANHLKGTGKADILLARGGDDTLDGKGGNDRLYGEAGQDNLKSGAGNDLLVGGDGDDNLQGQGGKDVLVGGAGNDALDGGAGKDTYLYLAKLLGSADLSAGDFDTIKATKGDCIVFDSSLWAQLTHNGNPLEDLAGHALQGNINADNNIAYDGTSVMIDLDGNGEFNADQDMTIALMGQASKVSVDSTGHYLVIG